MIADLHCHYPMHLLPEDRHPHGSSVGWFRQLRDVFEAGTVGVLAELISHPGWGEGWRVDLDGLETGKAGIVCSVLYWPPAEFDLDRGYGSDPEPGYFTDLQHQLGYVESDLEENDPDGDRHIVVRNVGDLDDEDRIRFVHCVEGGFHLGPDEDAMDANVRWLAEHGVVYITVAHLFYRGVAANAPALPMLSDDAYEGTFHQDPGIGLTDIGEALVRAMYKHRVLVDISHMRQDSIDATLDLVEELDRETQANPRDYPVIASHIGVRNVVEPAQSYNISSETIRRIDARGGVVGLIMAQHQLGETDDEAQSRAMIGKHIDAIADAVDGHQLTALGTDLDGFIKPTLAGIDQADDLAKLEGWIRDEYPQDADAILHGNAKRVLAKAFESRRHA